MQLRVFFCLILCWCGMVWALPKNNPVQGGLAVIELGYHIGKPVVYFGGHRVAVVPGKEGQHWVAIVGLPLHLEPGVAHLKRVGAQQPISFIVKAKDYPRQAIQIKEHRYSHPKPEDLARMQQDKVELDNLFNHWRDHSVESWHLLPPVKARISSEFGLRRVINGEPKEPHRGLDFAAPQGTVVHASAAGIVIGVSEYFLSGQTVIVDHGQSLETLYCHLDSVAVKLNQRVRAGEILGTVGRSGRATGPHLHYGVSLNGVRIDPRTLLQMD